ncbi:MAG TPA: PEGA domain-containing protein [Polyangiaceae bacterium]|nr:PEGA domain-containing protein [Polyangiaceae bacterium]
MAAALCGAAAPRAASAQADPHEDEQEARSHYARGVKLYQQGDFKLALAEFQRAYAIAASYKILYNIGQVSMQLNEFAVSQRAFERYLAEGGKRIANARRAQVERDLRFLRARTAKLTVTVDAEGAEVRVDDRPVGLTPLAGPLLVDAGNRQVSVSKNGRSTTKIVAPFGGDDFRVELKLSDEAPQATAARPKPEPPSPPPRPVEASPGLPATAWVGWSLAGASAVGAVVVGVLSLKVDQDAREKENEGAPEREVEAEERRARNLALTGGALAGGALLLSGLSLYITLKSGPPAQPPPASARVGFGPQRVLLTVSF